MLRLRVPKRLSLITPVRQKAVKVEHAPENTYVIQESGLESWTRKDKMLKVSLKVSSCKFGGNSDLDFHAAVKAFVEKLKKLGAVPEYERNEDGPNFCFWFDVSSAANPAYYCLATGNHGQEIVATLLTHHVFDEWNSQPDLVLIGNLKQLDEILHGMLVECEVPTY